MKFKEGDLVRRRIDTPYDRWAIWEDRCVSKNLDPTAVFTVATANPSIGVSFHGMGSVWWKTEYFEPVYDLSNKQLEDYL